MESPGHDPEPRRLIPLTERLGMGAADLGWFFRVAVSLCTALAELHRRGVHGRLSPGAVLVSPDGGVVRLAAPEPADTDDGTTPEPEAAYMSPEQTGRINRDIDHRSDFYSLGALFYAVLTGTPPFAGGDRLEIVHAHIARSPVPPATVDARIPEQVSRVVMRLLAKSADERYQSARGVRADLLACERDWTATGAVAPFGLGHDDIAERLQIPQRLVGRDRELSSLVEAFERTCAGETSLLLVAGYSGIGKTSLIGELFKPIVRQRGYFATGKFDQVARNIPYGALIQAFRGLVWQRLAESEERLARWRQRLLDALGTMGGVLTDVIPEIEFVIGRQPPPAPVDPAEAQNRFQFAFQNFLRTVAGEEHPLVLFLDDLQWVDAATLDLMHTLVARADLTHLLFVGAYRENEVDASHPLTGAAFRLQAAGAPVRTMTLEPLGVSDVRSILGEMLRRPPEDLASMADLIVARTGGNPFFVIQFLKSLEQDGLLRFDAAQARWSFDLHAVAAAGVTDNVVDLMMGRIRRLSPDAQSLLTLAACIGNQFDLSLFLAVSRMSPEIAASGFAEALEAGLIEPRVAADEGPVTGGATPTAYRFIHDRVQQAAYELITPGRQAQMHLELGRLLLAEGAALQDEQLFETANHLNLGSALVIDPAERIAIARVNLAAGRKARSSAAYEAAGGYLEHGIALLTDEHWRSEFELMFALGLEAAECHYLSGRFDAAERHFASLLENAVTPLQRVQVHSLRIVLYENLSRYGDALSSARDALALFGITFPDRDDDAAPLAGLEIDVIQRTLGHREIADLVALPDMSDPAVRALMRVLTLMWSAAYISGRVETARLISARMVRLTLEHGLAEDSAYGCVTHAITMGPVRRDYEAAYEWGTLALKLNDRFGDAKFRARIHQQFHAHVNLWRRPFATCIPHAREARRSGLESGDFNYAGYGTFTESWPAFLISRSLDDFLATYTPDLDLLERIRMEDFRAALRVVLNWALALQGRTADPVSLTAASLDDSTFVETYERSAPFFLTFPYTARLHLCILHGRYAEAVELLRRARQVTPIGTVWPVLLDFWGSLAIAGHWDEAPVEDRPRYWEELTRARESLALLAENCPENFRCFWLLVSAEMARLAGDAQSAVTLCEQALAYARQTDDLQQEALAGELGARAKLLLADESGAAAGIVIARRAYVAWGATAKVVQLDERYGALLRTALAPASLVPSPRTPENTSLDMATVLKLARAVAVEIELQNLVPQILRLALENAGADRALFIRERDGDLFVEAEATADTAAAVRRPDQGADDAWSAAVVRYVRRTGQDVVIGDSDRDERFSADRSVAAGRGRSILAVPVVQQGRTEGILYLENSLTQHAFTPARTEMMRILAAQAAIALENARLYAGLKDEVDRRTQAERSLRDALTEVEALKNRLEAENVYLQEEIRTQHNFNEIVGNSRSLLEALRRVELVAPTESTVLILGETGSGKELFARAIHSRSRRAGRPLVKVNCGAIAPGLVESELFGHVKGAFTGAIEKRVGRFELANGGTILLDEIGELPLEAQVKLLRVLQEQEFEPVGSSRTVRVDVRVIAATNRDLDLAVRDGRFRPDLLYRLNVFPVRIPPLRERRDDIPLLVSLFVAGLARRLGKPLRGFSPTGMDRLAAYGWPGNVRELQNVVERAAILASGPMLDVEDAFVSAGEPPSPSHDAGETLDSVQREHVVAILKRTGGVVEGARGAAAILGLHPNTLRSRMRKLGISLARAGP